MKAILAGLKQRHEKLGDRPILIHTVRYLSRCSHAQSQGD